MAAACRDLLASAKRLVHGHEPMAVHLVVRIEHRHRLGTVKLPYSPGEHIALAGAWLRLLPHFRPRHFRHLRCRIGTIVGKHDDAYLVLGIVGLKRRLYREGDYILLVARTHQNGKVQPLVRLFECLRRLYKPQKDDHHRPEEDKRQRKAKNVDNHYRHLLCTQRYCSGYFLIASPSRSFRSCVAAILSSSLENTTGAPPTRRYLYGATRTNEPTTIGYP